MNQLIGVVLMWKIVGLLTVIVLGVYVGGSVTWDRSTHGGPFAYFQTKYPDLDGQPLLDVANQEIEDFVLKQTNPDVITKYMEEIGFKSNHLENPNLSRSDISPDILEYISFRYSYGVFWWSHRWNFGIFINADKSIASLQSLQVCIRCP